MSRTTFNDADDAPSKPIGDPGGYLPCRVCGGSTPRAMLSQYGAQCVHCFGAFCANGAAGKRPPARTHGERVAILQGMRGAFPSAGSGATGGGVGWAVALRDREARSEPLTAAQRRAWRIALRVQSTT